MNLALFMTLNVGMNRWYRSGLIKREMTYYRELLSNPNVKKIYIFSYDTEIFSIVYKMIPKNIVIICMPKIFKYFGSVTMLIYSLISPIIFYKVLRNVDIMKSNQSLGAWSALIAAKLFGGKFVYRSGYITSSLLEKNVKSFWSTIKKRIYIIIEIVLAKYADCIIVSSKHNYEYLSLNMKCKKKIEIINNPIDVNFFNTDMRKKRCSSFLYVGRLSEEKNIISLINAVVNIGNKLTLLGSGALFNNLKKQYKDHSGIVFLGSKNTKEVKKQLSKHKFFCNVSFHEGMPKSLLEAMSMRCVCICTPTDAALEIIQDGVNGFISEDFSENAIQKALLRAINNSNNKIINSARNTVINRNNIKLAVMQEYDLYTKILSHNNY